MPCLGWCFFRLRKLSTTQNIKTCTGKRKNNSEIRRERERERERGREERERERGGGGGGGIKEREKQMKLMDTVIAVIQGSPKPSLVPTQWTTILTPDSDRCLVQSIHCIFTTYIEEERYNEHDQRDTNSFVTYRQNDLAHLWRRTTEMLF